MLVLYVLDYLGPRKVELNREDYVEEKTRSQSSSEAEEGKPGCEYISRSLSDGSLGSGGAEETDSYVK